MSFAISTKRTSVSIAVGLAMLAVVNANAQTQTPDKNKELEVIEVRATGFADSLSKALANKRLSAGSVDSILAEDIADFPDQNLAEALQRIPGVAITRDAGEGREITVRGLNSTFTRVQLNGMQAQSLAAGTGGIQTNRGFDFNVFASELFNQLNVYKTTSAALEEGSLGATVGLRTARPFDFDENVVAVNAQEGYNDQSEQFDPRFSGLASYSNDDKSFGILFSAAFSDRLVNNIGADTGRWEDDTFGACSACSSQAEVDQVSSAWHPRFPRMSDKTDDQQRVGITTSVQFIPSDSTTVTLDLLYANIQATRNEPFMEAISLARTGASGLKQSDVTAFQIDQNNTMYAATIADVDVRSEFFLAEWESTFSQYSINIEQDFSADLSATLLLGTSKSELDNRESTVIYEHFSENDPNRIRNYAQSSSAVSYDFSDMLNPVIAYSFDTANPANWETSEFRDRNFDAQSSTDNAKLELAYILTDEVTLRAGTNYKEYSYEIFGERADASFSSVEANDGVADNTACGIGFEVTNADGSVVNVGGQSFFMAQAADIQRFVDSGCWPYKRRAGDTRSVTEESLGYFVQADFNFEVAGKVLRGNAGVRHVKTDLSSTGITNDTIEVTVEHDYSDTLPAINLAYEVAEDWLVRASWAKVMSRPNLGTLNPGGSVSIFGDPRVSYGNPFIEPFRADASDLSVEWYFAESSLLSVAYFKKDIESLPISQTDIIPWAETGLPNSLLGAQLNDLIDAEFEVRRTVNGPGGNLDGFEIQYQQQLDFLPGPDWVKKFGMLINLTFVDSEVSYGTDRKGPLTGQSDESSNFTLYWEDDVFSARVSVANRGEYFSNLSSSDEHKWRQVDSSTHVDMSASYKLSENLKLSLEGINLTDEPTGEYLDPDAKRIITEQNTGRQFFIGVSYRM